MKNRARNRPLRPSPAILGMLFALAAIVLIAAVRNDAFRPICLLNAFSLPSTREAAAKSVDVTTGGSTWRPCPSGPVAFMPAMENFKEGGRPPNPTPSASARSHVPGDLPLSRFDRFPVSSLALVLTLLLASHVALFRFRRSSHAENAEGEQRRILSIFDTMGDPVCVRDPRSGELLYANHAFLAIGTDEEETCDSPWKSSPDAESLPEESRTFECRKGGEVRCYRRRTSVIDWPDGRKVLLETAFDMSDIKRTEEELIRSGERYRGLVEKAPIAISVTREGRMNYVNPRYVAMFGYESIEEMIGLHLRDILAPEQRGEVLDRNRRREAGETVLNSYETMGMRKDGSTFPMRADAVIIDWEGQPCTFGFLTDITRQKEAERALREGEERFRLLFEKAPIGYQSLNDEGQLLDVNESWLELLGYRKDEVVGKQFEDFLVPRHVEHFRANFPRFKAEGQMSGTRFEMKRGDGGIMAVELSGKVGYDAGGRVKQTHCVMRDITRQILAEEALRESERRYRSLFEEAPHAILEEDFTELARALGDLRASGVTDPRSYFEDNPDEVDRFISMVKIVSVNKAALDFYGASAPEKLCANLTGMLDPESRATFIDEIVAISRGATRFTAETWNRTLQGVRKSVTLKLSVLPDQHRAHTRALVSIIDTTEQKRLEEQLRHSQKMEAVGTMAGGIAHDFNNILAIILGFTELALQQAPESTPLRSNLEQVLQASERARDLVKQILTFSRKDTGAQRSVTDLVLVAAEAARFARASLPATIEIRARVPETPMPALVDHTQIHQVIINLCTNAAHAMSESGGILGIEVAEYLVDEFADMKELSPGPHVRISVSDTGHGMDRETLSRIFNPYFTTKEVGKGSGLGLAVVHGIVKRHGGAIRVYSEPGRGSIFHVIIPKLAESPPDASPAPRDVRTGNERILLVDDEPVVLDVGRLLLKNLGYHVETMADPLLALDLFRQAPDAFDLVITDYTMPKLTGEKFAAKLMEIRQDIPILLCTGFSEQMDEVKAREFGIRRFIMKPLSLLDLAEAVRSALELG